MTRDTIGFNNISFSMENPFNIYLITNKADGKTPSATLGQFRGILE